MSGFYEGSDLADKTFYGFRLNLEVISPQDGTPVVLPQEGLFDKADYRQWVWSRDTLRFQWGNNGHLQVKFL